MICVIRNPRDVCVSFQNHFILTENFTGDLQLIADIMLKDIGPYYAPFFTHILSYWKQRENPNLLIVHYEEMQRDIAGIFCLCKLWLMLGCSYFPEIFRLKRF